VDATEKASPSGDQLGEGSTTGSDGQPEEEPKPKPVPVKSEHTSKSRSTGKHSTLRDVQSVRCDESLIRSCHSAWKSSLGRIAQAKDTTADDDDLDAVGAEERLSLTVSKADFGRMKIIGQFNLGFVVALRPGNLGSEDDGMDRRADEIFIIDQHASD
jgi:DNA mismatch repair protein PMS2